ncbi:MAG: hypothetical protein N2738_06325 [Thermodesulfovibrionales bacterium]|nr:hypothetical protein [Thermodesulfovibrionales bacterium]
MKKIFVVTLFCMVLIFNAVSVSATDLKANDVQTIMLHEGKLVTVTGKVVGTHIAKSGKVRFLNFGEDYRTSFTVVIFTGDLDKFTSTIGEPTEYYKNKTVKVTGKVSIYRDKPQIITNSPSQIRVVE